MGGGGARPGRLAARRPDLRPQARDERPRPRRRRSPRAGPTTTTASGSSTSPTPTWSATRAASRRRSRRSRRSTSAWARWSRRCTESGGACIVTADHGNAEQMLEPDGSPEHGPLAEPGPVRGHRRGDRARRRRRARGRRPDRARAARDRAAGGDDRSLAARSGLRCGHEPGRWPPRRLDRRPTSARPLCDRPVRGRRRPRQAQAAAGAPAPGVGLADARFPDHRHLARVADQRRVPRDRGPGLRDLRPPPGERRGSRGVSEADHLRRAGGRRRRASPARSPRPRQRSAESPGVCTT